jgi:WD40 repeat protein
MTDPPGRLDHRRSRAVLIGTEACADPQIPAVPGATASCAGLKAVLTDPGLCGWPDRSVTVLPVGCGVRDARLTLRACVREASVVLLMYFVGPAVYVSRGQLFLGLSETWRRDAEDTGLAYDQVRQELLTSHARLTVVILDCDYSGQVIDDLPKQAAELPGIEGTFVLASADRRMVPDSRGSAVAPTLLTAELLTALRAGIPGDQEALSLDQLYEVLERRLRQAGHAAPNRLTTAAAGASPFVRNVSYEPSPDGNLGHRLRRREVIIGAALVAGAGGAGLATAASSSDGPSLRPRPTPTRRAPAGPGTLFGPASFINGITFSPDGRYLAAASMDHNAWVWDMSRSDNAATPIPHPDRVYDLTFSPNGKMLATASLDGTIRLWDAGSWRPRTVGSQDYLIRHEYDAWSVAFSPDGTLLASSTSWAKPADAGKVVAICYLSGKRPPVYLSHPNTVTPLRFSPDGKTLVTGCNDTKVRSWDVATQKLNRTWEHRGAVLSLSFQPGLPRRFASSGSWDHTVQLRSLDSDRPLETFGADILKFSINRISFSPDGNSIATAGVNTVYVLDVKTGQQARPPLNCNNTFGVAYSPTGKFLAATQDDVIRTWTGS